MNAGISESNLLPDTDAEEFSSRSPSLNSRLTHPTTAIGTADDDVENSFAVTHQGKICTCTPFAILQ